MAFDFEAHRFEFVSLSLLLVYGFAQVRWRYSRTRLVWLAVTLVGLFRHLRRLIVNETAHLNWPLQERGNCVGSF